MATKFVVTGLDLDLDLALLDGTEILLKPKIRTDTRTVLEIVGKWRDMEKARQVNKEGSASPFEMECSELAMVYDRDAEWFLQNLDPATLQEVMVHVAQTMGGAKKNERSSSQL